jgi:pimeloyl-ACP methyl ester carboxylesterase
MKLGLLLACLVVPALFAAPPAFVKEGKGPAILLIHGYGGNKEVWKEIAPGLAKDHTVVRVDLPGSGQSAAPAIEGGAVDLEVIAKDLAALVRQEQLAPCLIVGHSMGGPIAALTVLQDPKAFRGLVLVDSFLGSVPAPYFESTLTGLEKEPKPALAAFFGPMSTGKEQTERLATEALRLPIPILQAYLRAMTRDFMKSRHASLTLPVMQFAAGPGESDPAKREAQRAMFGFKNLPDYREVAFPKAKHWIMWDEPEAFTKALRAFESGLAKS